MLTRTFRGNEASAAGPHVRRRHRKTDRTAIPLQQSWLRSPQYLDERAQARRAAPEQADERVAPLRRRKTSAIASPGR
jgi:hypothetical protein